MNHFSATKRTAVHPYSWLWEPLEKMPSFVLRSMFGAKAVYLDGQLQLCFCAKREPWRGLLVCTDRVHQSSLLAEIPALFPHAILPKWLYLPESDDNFEPMAEKIVQLVRRRDPRIGVSAKPKTPRSTEKPARKIKKQDPQKVVRGESG